MKRIIALSLAVLMLAALFCACGETDNKGDDGKGGETKGEVVKTVVDAKEDDPEAEKYAKSVSTDENGNKVYEFDEESYKNYNQNYNNRVSSSITKDVLKNHDSDFGQYCYINDEKKAIIVGVNPGKYDKAAASKEAESLAKKAFPYFKSLKDPVETISVQYVNANNQEEVYGKFDFKVE